MAVRRELEAGRISYHTIELGEVELAEQVSDKKLREFSENISALGFELISGFNYVTQNNVVISPMIGIEYNRISKTDYQESGTTNQNLKVTKRPDNKFEGIIGMRMGKN